MIPTLASICESIDPPIEVLPTHVRKKPGMPQTHADGAMQAILNAHGEAHLRFVLMTIVESENNRNALYGPLIWAVSDRVLANREWADTGSKWFEAFDAIDLCDVWERMRSIETPSKRSAISTVLFEHLRAVFEPENQRRLI